MRRACLTLTGVLVAATMAGGGVVSTETATAVDRTCAAADNRPTVRFLDDDSGVANDMAGGGCSINDVIDDEQQWSSHGASDLRK